MRTRISVILNSYLRVRFVNQALESVLRQDSCKQFEVILLSAVPGFGVDPRLESLAEESGNTIHVVPVRPGPVGAGLSAALREASGDFLAILDDDDVWERRKVHEIENVIDEEPSLAFFHNAQLFVDETNSPLSPLNPNRAVRHPSSWMPENRTLRVDSSQPKSIAAAQSFAPDFNNSSMTIRRSVLLESQKALESVRRGEDTFLYYCALASRGVLHLTSDRLTRYRLHSGASTSGAQDGAPVQDRWAGYRDYVDGHLDSLALVREYIVDRAAPAVKDWLELDEAFWTTMRWVVSPAGNTRKGKLQLRALLGGASARPRSKEILAASLGIAAAIAPGPARSAFKAWRASW